MPSEGLENLSKAILYEGYSLYPYRPSSLKNQYPFTFGVLYPPAYCLDATADRPFLRVECLFSGSGDSRFLVRLRFLQQIEGATVERDIPIPLGESVLFSFSPIVGSAAGFVRPLGGDKFKLSVEISNVSKFDGTDRNHALIQSMLSTHLILRVEGGRFFSMVDPPEEMAKAAAECRNIGTWPVLLGEDTMFCSPIILEDFPRVAQESPGDLFDNTEIDEILNLRIQTLAESERREIFDGDERVRQLVERAESLTQDEMRRLHAVMEPGRLSEARLRIGSRVRLHPKGNADIYDIFLDGKTAVIESIEHDFEDRCLISVTLEEIPAEISEELAKLGIDFSSS